MVPTKEIFSSTDRHREIIPITVNVVQLSIEEKKMDFTHFDAGIKATHVLQICFFIMGHYRQCT